MDNGNRNTMDPAEREAMDDLEWSRGFDDADRPEGSHGADGEVMSNATSGDEGVSDPALRDEPDTREQSGLHEE